MTEKAKREARESIVGGVPVQFGDLDQAYARICDAAVARNAISFKLVNSYNVALASKDADYAAALLERSVNFPDGTPLAWLMNLLSNGRPHQRAVRGPDLFEKALLRPSGPPLRHFLLGGQPETLSAISDRINASSRGAEIAGTWAPPFAPVHEMFDEAYDRITRADADVVWVGLGTPKQDFLAVELSRSCDRPFVCVGAAFDFLAGTVPEAPKLIRGSGLEWLFRLVREPRRLWRRYVFGNLTFLNVAVRELRRR